MRAGQHDNSKKLRDDPPTPHPPPPPASVLRQRRENWKQGEAMKLPKPIPINILSPAKLSLLNLSKKCHQLWTKGSILIPAPRGHRSHLNRSVSLFPLHIISASFLISVSTCVLHRYSEAYGFIPTSSGIFHDSFLQVAQKTCSS